VLDETCIESALTGWPLALDETLIESALTSALGVPIAAAVVADRLDVELLSEAEHRRYVEVLDTPRCDSWLRGRAALKRVLARLGESSDTGELCFPHGRLSLTHSGQYAVAVAAAGSAGPCALPRRSAGAAGAELPPRAVPVTFGLGVDLEIGRAVSAEAARFFLSAAEREGLASASGSELLRLWTVKEAVFKADLRNHGCGMLDYQLADAGAVAGLAYARAEPDAAIRYASIEVSGGFLSAAVALAHASKAAA
jgi:4'-phosphopantetheinyl transferase EntD